MRVCGQPEREASEVTAVLEGAGQEGGGELVGGEFGMASGHRWPRSPPLGSVVTWGSQLPRPRTGAQRAPAASAVMCGCVTCACLLAEGQLHSWGPCEGALVAGAAARWGGCLVGRCSIHPQLLLSSGSPFVSS